MIPRYQIAYPELEQDLSFKDTGLGLEAFYRKDLIGGYSPNNPFSLEAIELWKQDVRSYLGAISTTVIMRTRCNCQRIIHGVGSDTHYTIPVMSRSPKGFLQAQTPHGVMAIECDRREFRHRGELCPQTGFRIYKEV